MKSHVKCLNGNLECAALKHGYCSPMWYMCDPSGIDSRFIKINMQICLPLFGLHTRSLHCFSMHTASQVTLSLFKPTTLHKHLQTSPTIPPSLRLCAQLALRKCRADYGPRPYPSPARRFRRLCRMGAANRLPAESTLDTARFRSWSAHRCSWNTLCDRDNKPRRCAEPAA